MMAKARAQGGAVSRDGSCLRDAAGLRVIRATLMRDGMGAGAAHVVQSGNGSEIRGEAVGISKTLREKTREIQLREKHWESSYVSVWRS